MRTPWEGGREGQMEEVECGQHILTFKLNCLFISSKHIYCLFCLLFVCMI